jgi:hypothetical protein
MVDVWVLRWVASSEGGDESQDADELRSRPGSD